MSEKYTEEEQAEARAKWVAALRSDEFKQAHGGLTGAVADSVGYCCLGVACEVAVREGAVANYDVEGLILPGEVSEWLGLEDCAGSTTQEVVDELGGGHASLWELNDVAAMSFKEIANVIESGKVRLA